MNIVLRILVILTLVLNGVALWFAQATYAKRNLLIDRNDIFRDFTVGIAKTFEAEDAVHENTAANHPARDISEVSLATADITPDNSDFWEGYKEELEKIDGKHYAIDGRASDLDEVYILNAEGKPELDGRGAPITEGAPMKTLLAEVQKKALAQFARMNNVRTQLTKVREELEDTITELNAVKKEARQTLKTLAQREETITQLEGKVSQLEGDISTLKDQVASLESDKATLQADLDKKSEELDTANEEITKLKDTLARITLEGNKGNGAAGAIVTANVAAGEKGTVVRVNNEYNYCFVKVTDATMKELLGENLDQEMPKLELYIRRPGNDAEPIAKIRLRTITTETNTITCDILSAWKQSDVQRGDVVFYLD